MLRQLEIGTLPTYISGTPSIGSHPPGCAWRPIVLSIHLPWVDAAMTPHWPPDQQKEAIHRSVSSDLPDSLFMFQKMVID